MPGPPPKKKRARAPKQIRKYKAPPRARSFVAATDPLRYDSALEWFRSQIPMTEEQLGDTELEVRKLAFHIAGGVQLDVLTSVWKALQRSLEDGTDFRVFKRDAAEMLEHSWGGEIPGRLETIFRTNLQNAYGAGRYVEQYSDEARRDRPYVRLDTTQDSRESDICEALNDLGAVPKDGAFIATHHPPLHFNCRTIEVDLTDDQAKELGLTEHPPDVHADEGFGGVPNFNWRPDLNGYPEPLRRIAATKGIDAGPAPASLEHGIRTVAPEQFKAAFDKAFAENSRAGYVSHYSVKELAGMRTLLTADGKAGIAVHDHGDGRIEGTALFNNGSKKGAGVALLDHAVAHEGVNYLECFGDHLKDTYEKHGFKVDTSSPFNEEYAPKNWDYDKDGRPNYYTLKLKGPP